MGSTAVNNGESRTRSIPWKPIGIAAAAVALVALIVWALVYFTPLMSVRHIEVEGNQRVTSEQIVDEAAVAEGTPLAQVDSREAGERVAGLPWIKSVTVSREWPSTLKVAVEEYTAVAFRRRDDAAELYAADGHAFAIDAPPEGAVEITGDAAADPAVVTNAVAVVSSLSDHGRSLVASVEARGPYEYALHLEDERMVIWGAAEDNENKALAFDTVVQREGKEFNISNPRLVTSR